ncbi:MAG TPA: radical SAM protein [Candidatus Acidoferrales bacterium]|nr:radical SAM protein [Candidatus Acidoferrales bacterium]
MSAQSPQQTSFAGDPKGAGQHKPRLIFWEVTKGCNLRCVHCRATATELASPTDLPTEKALDIINQIADFANPILVLSGGEPLYRPDIFQLAKHATNRGLRVALATNGTLVTKEIAKKVVDAGVQRVSISLDGADAETHDSFRGIPGAFDAAIYGFRNLKELGMPVQINMTIARHNAEQLPRVLDMVRGLGADALHTFLLVPVGCGVDIADEQMVPPEEYERLLNWFYDQAQIGDIELKATCAPHYFRVVRQRRAEERKAAGQGATAAVAEATANAPSHGIGPTEMTMPGSTGIDLRPTGHPGAGHFKPSGLRHDGMPHPHHPGGDPNAMNAMTKGCLAGTGVCFISHEGEVYPCGYLPALAGDLRKQPFAEVWTDSQVFNTLRDTDKLTGKCGCCEFRNVCKGCRARAFAVKGDYMAEEPFCVYQPKTMAAK